MNTQSNTLGDSAVPSQSVGAAATPPSQAFYWSVRRELWEYRSIYMAPLVVAAVAFVAFCLSASAGIWVQPLRLDSAHFQSPYDMLAGLMMGTGIILTVFYCLDALHGERRDRSILFWKSMPVSDTTTVLAKASIPLIVLPAIVIAVTVVTQLLMLLVSSLIVPASGGSVAALWSNLSFFQMSFLLAYHIVTAHVLWAAPVYCWFLLVSGWAKRAVFVWAVLPVFVIGGIERILGHTPRIAFYVARRFIGDVPNAVAPAHDMFPTNPMTHITPGAFFGSPSLWIGLAIAAAFLAAAVRLRRYQGPI